MTGARYALYLIPHKDVPLGAALASWFAAPPAGAAPALWRRLTAEPARYGPHMTIWAPTPLPARAEPRALAAAARAVASALPTLICPPCVLSVRSQLLSLRPPQDDRELRRLSDVVVGAMDVFRGPLSASDAARRVAQTQGDPEAAARLARWGYPHVGAGFRPHFTLAVGPNAGALADVARAHFATAAAAPTPISALTLVAEPGPGGPFAPIAECPFARDDGGHLVDQAKSA